MYHLITPIRQGNGVIEELDIYAPHELSNSVFVLHGHVVGPLEKRTSDESSPLRCLSERSQGMVGQLGWPSR